MCVCVSLGVGSSVLKKDFEKEINKLLTIIPRDRQTLLFSATMTSKVELKSLSSLTFFSRIFLFQFQIHFKNKKKKVSKLQRASLVNPVKVAVSRKYQTVETLLQQYVFIPAKLKDVYLISILNDLTGKVK